MRGARLKPLLYSISSWATACTPWTKIPSYKDSLLPVIVTISMDPSKSTQSPSHRNAKTIAEIALCNTHLHQLYAYQDYNPDNGFEFSNQLHG